jgi:hypothetical protein
MYFVANMDDYKLTLSISFWHALNRFTMHFGKASQTFWTLCKKRANFEYICTTASFKVQIENMEM